MIVVRLKGGLGNQMFQYAAGRRLAQARSVELKLDLSWFDNIGAEETPRRYELKFLNIRETIATAQDIALLKEGTLRRLARKYLRLPLSRIVVVEEPFVYDPTVLELGENVYLDGYW